MANLSLNIAVAVSQARPKAEDILRTTTASDTSNTTGTTIASSTAVSNNATANTATQKSTTPKNSSSKEPKFSTVLGLLTLVLSIFYSALPWNCFNATIELKHHKQFFFDCIRSDKNRDVINLAPHYHKTFGCSAVLENVTIRWYDTSVYKIDDFAVLSHFSTLFIRLSSCVTDFFNFTRQAHWCNQDFYFHFLIIMGNFFLEVSFAAE